MLTFIPWDLLVLQIIESSGLDGGGTLPGLCRQPFTEDVNNKSLNVTAYF